MKSFLKSLSFGVDFFVFFLRRGGVNVPNRIIDEVVAPSVCGPSPTKSPSSRGLVHTPELWWYYFGVDFFGPLAHRGHIRVRIPYRKLRRHPSFSTTSLHLGPSFGVDSKL